MTQNDNQQQPRELNANILKLLKLNAALFSLNSQISKDTKISILTSIGFTSEQISDLTNIPSGTIRRIRSKKK